MDKASYINHILNTSAYRNSCRFSRAERFTHAKQMYPYKHSDPPNLITTSALSHHHELAPSAMAIAPDARPKRKDLALIDIISQIFQKIIEEQH